MLYKKIQEYFPVILIFIGSIILTFSLHLSGSFSYVEMKLYDFRFGLRGAISGTPLYYETKLPSAEYFIDTDPCLGSGIPLYALDGSFDSNDEQLNFTIRN